MTRIEQLADLLRQRCESVATAESCTGGLIAAACTSLAGSSDWFDCGFVSYSYAAKSAMLGVAEALIIEHGAVSEPVAVAMAEGALSRSDAHWAVAVTGIAGPGGAVPGKPVGTVWLALAQRGQGCTPQLLQLAGDRAAIRASTVDAAIDALCAAIEAAGPAAAT